MTDTSFTVVDRDFAEALAFEQRKADVQLAHHRAEASRSSGVSYGGMGPTPFNALKPRDLIAAATASAERAKAWRASPRGRLSMAITALDLAGYQHTAERMRGAYSRGIASEATPRLKELSFLLSELASIPSNDGTVRDAVQGGVRAIAEMLGDNEQKVA